MSFSSKQVDNESTTTNINDQKEIVVSPVIAYFSAFLGSFLCFLPQISGWDVLVADGDKDWKAEVKNTLDNRQFQFCVVASFAIALPILMDIVIDSFLRSTIRNFSGIKFALWVLISASVACTSCAIFYVIPNHDYQLLYCIERAISIIVLCSCLSFLNTYGPIIWKWKYNLFIVIFFSAGQVCHSIFPYLNENIQDHVRNTAYSLILITCLVLSLLSCLWIRRILILYRITYIISNDDICCTLNMIAGMTFWILQFLIFITKSTTNPFGGGVVYYVARMYSLIGFMTLISSVNARFIRSTIILSHAIREAETKRMLVGYFSHEIRTPLNSVLMGLQLAKRFIHEDVDREELTDIFEELHSQCDLAVDILNDLLLYERLEEGIIDLNFKPVSMKPFLHKKIKAFLPQCKDKGVSLNLVFPESTDATRSRGYLQSVERAYCRADEDKFGQVIRTLLANAIECTPKDSTVTVVVDLINSGDSLTSQDTITRARLTTAANDASTPFQAALQSFKERSAKFLGQGSIRMDVKSFLRIKIIDEGPGISKEEQATIFDNALSFTAGVLQVRQGQGLGLWISHNIMTLHQGEIFVSSDGIGKGSTFTIEIPTYFSTPSGRIRFARSGAKSEMVSHIIPPSRRASRQGSSSLRGSALFHSSSEKRPSLSSRDRVDDISGADSDLLEVMSDTIFKSFGSMRSFRSFKSMGTSTHALIHPSITNSPIGRPKQQLQRSTTANGRPHLRTIKSMLQQSSKSLQHLQEEKSSKTASRIVEVAELSTKQKMSRYVLVVDDATINRKMLCRLLVGHCHGTVEAEDGAAAVENYKLLMSQKKTFSLILMDYQMPKMDGPTAAKTIRELGYKGPIIGVTGNTLPQQIQTFVASGADRVVSKPLNFHELVRNLKEMDLEDLLEPVVEAELEDL